MKLWSEDGDPDRPCPVCGAPTVYDVDCPGYERDGRVWVCGSGCGNADTYTCANEDCDWWFAYPWERATPLGVRPDWFEERVSIRSMGTTRKVTVNFT